jgi:anti-sigma factor RsiW
MTDAEQLVQRFVDQELSAEERLQFVARLGRDEALRQRAMDLERLVLDVRRLPRPDVPAGFTARVLERTEPARSTWRGLTEALWAPRALEWNLASAAAAACLLVFAFGAAVAGALSQTRSAPQPRTVSAAPAGAPVLVRLVVLQPGARTVQAAGDFNGWNPDRTPLAEVSNGAWMVTIPLEPGRYEYMFVVDGQRWVADPFALEQSDDGFGSHNAVLEVRAPLESRS